MSVSPDHQPDLTPPPQLVEVAKKVDARLHAVLDQQTEHWTAIDPRLGEAIGELARMTTSGGKRLRAAFAYWAWRGFYDLRPELRQSSLGSESAATDLDVGSEELIVNLGAAFEFLQIFALIHDDIMDDSPTRRGTTTIHVHNANRVTDQGWRGDPRRYGEGVAILVGDLGHVYADQLTNGISPQARQIWDELRIELNLGQYLDMRSAAAGELDLETARSVAVFKSALYTIVRPLQLGACLHGPVDSHLLEQLDSFGRPLGRAFQLRDDALGVLGDETTLGKPVGDDLREGKPTELVAYALANSSATQAKMLRLVGQPNLSQADVTRLVEVLHETGAVAHNENEINSLVTAATEALVQIEFDPVAIEALQSMAHYVAVRTT